jgi:type I restriction enzyme S subunit
MEKRIIEVLEDHLSRLDAAQQYVQSALSRLESLQRSSLDHHFGRREVALGDLIEGISAGKSFGGSNSPAQGDEWGIIKVSAMTWGKFLPSENKAVAVDRVDPRFEIHEGDLLVSRANTVEYVGASVLVGQIRPKLLLSDKSLRVAPRAGISTRWLWRALQAPSARMQISELATGTKDSMRNISQASLRRILLPNADPVEQSAAVHSYEEVAVAAGRMNTEIVATHARSTALRRSLLRAAFNGELVDQDLSDGPAVAAIIRIHQQPKITRKRAASTNT